MIFKTDLTKFQHHSSGNKLNTRFFSCLLFFLSTLALGQTGGESELLHISIFVQPRGARVYIDNEFKGMGTNFVVPAGIHKISLRESGYNSLESSITVSNRNTVFRFALELLPAGVIKIATEPDGAQLFLDGLYCGTTDKTVLEAPGVHNLHVEKPGHYSVDTSIIVMARTKSVCKFYLPDANPSSFAPNDIDNLTENEQIAWLEKKGLAIISCNISPADASIFINNAPVTAKTAIVSPGTYGITASKQGFLLYHDSVTVLSGKISHKNIILNARTSVIAFDIVPSNAQITVDNESYTGKLFAEVPAGRHAVLISKKGYITYREVVDAVEGKTFVLSHDLKSNVGSLKLSVSPQRTNIRLAGSEMNPIERQGDSEFPLLIPGEYNIHCQAVNHVDFDTIITVFGGGTSELEIKMKPVDPNLILPRSANWVYSCVMPGLGQLMQGRTYTGIGVFLANAGALSFLMASIANYNHSVDDYNKASAMFALHPISVNRKNTIDKRNKANTNFKYYILASVVSGVAYLFNVENAYEGADPQADSYTAQPGRVAGINDRFIECGFSIRLGL